MSYLYAFEKLQVWNEAKLLVVSIYKLTESFPATERFGLTSQLRRAAVSIMSNLAEGSGRRSPKDQAHFYQIAYSSLIEILNQLILSKELEYINEYDLVQTRGRIEIISVKLNALRKSCMEKLA